MTNTQAQGYAVLALKNILREKGWLVKDITSLCRSLDREMYRLMDILTEDEAEEKAEKILVGVVY